MSDFLGPAKVTKAGLDADITAKINDASSAARGALNATFVPKWKATTAYLAGEKVLSPAGDVVSAKVNFTSGASYSAANWDVSATVAAKLDAATAATTYATNAQTVFRKTPPIPRPPLTHLTTFAAGHGWTGSGLGASNLNDTSEGVLSTQVVSGTSLGDAAFTSYLLGPTMPTFDPNGKVFVVWVKIDDISKFDDLSMRIYAADGGFANFTSYRVIANTRNVARAGEWFPATVSYSDATVTGTGHGTSADRLRLYIKDKGAGAVTIKFGGISYHTKLAAYPKGVVVFTFDDMFPEHLSYAAPLLTAKGWKASVYPIIDRVGNVSYLSLAQMRQLTEMHGWEVGGHATTQAIHSAAGGLTSITRAEIDAELRAVKSWSIANGFFGEYFAYPGGAWDNSDLQELVPNYFPFARVTAKGFRETLPPSHMARVRSQSIGNGQTLANITAEVDKAYAGGDLMVLTFHGFDTTSTNSTTWAKANFEGLIAHIAAKGDMPVQTVSKVLATLTAAS